MIARNLPALRDLLEKFYPALQLPVKTVQSRQLVGGMNCKCYRLVVQE